METTKSNATVEICFIVDATGSMSSYIQKTKDTIKMYVEEISKKVSDADIRFAFVGYRDHKASGNWKEVIKTCDFTNGEKLTEFIVKEINADGGGDEPEAVIDAIHEVNNQDHIHWKDDSVKYIVHVLDAPPHGKIFTTGGDDFPEGCPCKFNYEEEFKEINSCDIDYYIVRCTDHVDKMIEYFKTLSPNVCVVDLQSDASLREVVIAIVDSDKMANYIETKREEAAKK
jgi:hypothetical protein